jgi:hypothetical protein
MSARKPAKVAQRPAGKVAAARPAGKPVKAAAKPVAQAKPAIAALAAPSSAQADRTTSAGDTSSLALALAGDIDRALNEGRIDILSEAAVQALMAAACRSYSAKIEAGGSFLPLADRSRVTSTDVMVSASGLLKAANLAVFELGMWQSWTGR